MGVYAFLQGEVPDVEVHCEHVEYLGEEKDFYEVWEEDGDDCWNQLSTVEEGFLGICQTEYSALHQTYSE